MRDSALKRGAKMGVRVLHGASEKSSCATAL